MTLRERFKGGRRPALFFCTRSEKGCMEGIKWVYEAADFAPESGGPRKTGGEGCRLL